MAGWPDATWHLEFAAIPPMRRRPGRPRRTCWFSTSAARPVWMWCRLVDAGGTRVTARNPYWEQWGVTIADPDSYRLVLSSRSWP
jgi:hypothetical protein